MSDLDSFYQYSILFSLCHSFEKNYLFVFSCKSLPVYGKIYEFYETLIVCFYRKEPTG